MSDGIPAPLLVGGLLATGAALVAAAVLGGGGDDAEETRRFEILTRVASRLPEQRKRLIWEYQEAWMEVARLHLADGETDAQVVDAIVRLVDLTQRPSARHNDDGRKK